MDDGMDGWMDGWKVSFHPQRPLLYVIMFFMSKMTYLLFPNPPTPPVNMKVGIVKSG
jgi:hypothetical protein